MKNGICRSSLLRQDGQAIIFNFETKDSAGRKVLYVLNGGEKLFVDNIKTKGDSIFIEMPFFESGFAARLDENGNLHGSWLKKGTDSVRIMPFIAMFNQPLRFPVASPPAYNISGRWAVSFTDRNNKVYKSVGEFQQNGSKLTGTFLTETGDYRYQEGVVTGDSLKLSCFDGGNAYLFTAKINNDSAISPGSFYSGAVNVEKWTAKKDINASLPDGYSDTTLKPGENKFNFRFKSTDDKFVSIKDDKYKGKVVIVQLLGSWCPNCMDETKFLSEYYKANREKGIEIIGLAYEYSTDWERSKKSVTSFQTRFDVAYPILITGVTASDSLRTEKTLPQLNKISAFPTSIFIDKRGIVRKIYTGFTGPGTGEHYEAFRKEFY
ncbi:MAG: TlpA disulfide reductase family protein [Chitinophagaceae bacterium]